MSEIISESGSLEGYEPEDLIPEEDAQEFVYTAPMALREMPGSDLAPFYDTTVTGTFRTTDERDVPSIAFITVYRDITSAVEKPIAHYYDGYGIALRPSTDANMNNIFVVDSGLAVPSVVLENVVHTGWGDMAYLAATHKDIEPNKDYYFRLDIYSGNAMRFWVWEATTSMPGAPDLRYGAYQPLSEGRYVGISTNKTESYFWDWDNLAVSYRNDRLALQLYAIDCTNFIDDFSVVAYAYGVGELGGAEEHGVQLYVWNYATAEWELKDEHVNGPGGLYSSIRLEANELNVLYYLGAGINDVAAATAYTCYAMLATTYPSSFNDAIDSTLYVDYVYAENWTTTSSHVGGMGDIYLKTNSNPTAAYIDIYNIGVTEWLLSSNTKIVGDLQLPVTWISYIELLDFAGNPTGVILEPITHWAFEVFNETLRYSTRETNYLIFSGVTGSNVRVNYWVEPAVETAQNLLDSETSRNVTDDYLAKLYTPVELYIEATYVGSAHATDIRSNLAQWINGGTLTTLDDDAIEIQMQSIDLVSNASVTSFYAYRHNPDGTVDYLVPDSNGDIILDEREQFVLIGDAAHIEVTT